MMYLLISEKDQEGCLYKRSNISLTEIKQIQDYRRSYLKHAHDV